MCNRLLRCEEAGKASAKKKKKKEEEEANTSWKQRPQQPQFQEITENTRKNKVHFWFRKRLDHEEKKIGIGGNVYSNSNNNTISYTIIYYVLRTKRTNDRTK